MDCFAPLAKDGLGLMQPFSIKLAGLRPDKARRLGGLRGGCEGLIC